MTQFTERALAHELVTSQGGPNAAYHISLARLKLQKGEYPAAEENLNEALQFDFQVNLGIISFDDHPIMETRNT